MSKVLQLSIAPADSVAELFVNWVFAIVAVPQLSIVPPDFIAELSSSMELLNVSNLSLVMDSLA